MTNYVLEAVDDGGFDADVIDLRWLDPCQHRLADNRIQCEEDQSRDHRRAGRHRHQLRRLARRRDPATLLRLARSIPSSGSPAARRHRASARSSSEPPSPKRTKPPQNSPKLRRPDPCLLCTACPKSPPEPPTRLLSEWLVAENTEFAQGDTLVTVETDKASVDIEAETSGGHVALPRRSGNARRGR